MKIKYHIGDLYGIDVATGSITAVADQLLPELNAWEKRLLESHYPTIWMDAVYYKIKGEGRYVGKAIYTLFGLMLAGKKEILGLYLSDNEGVNYRLTRLTDIQSRDVEDIPIACVDGLTSFS